MFGAPYNEGLVPPVKLSATLVAIWVTVKLLAPLPPIALPLPRGVVPGDKLLAVASGEKYPD